MNVGLVKWFDEEKGFGLIGTPDKDDYFLHISNFAVRPDKISKGTAIVFSEKFEKNKNAAKNCKPINLAQIDDWYLAMFYLGKKDSVNIELEVSGKSRFGNSYKRTETNQYSLIELATNQFFKNKSEEEIKTIVKRYFDEKLDESLFIRYCDFIENRIIKILPKENVDVFFAEIFEYFGSKLSEKILFQVWKSKKFKYIGKTSHEDYEIPKNIIESNLSDIGLSELIRIKEYDYGNELCTKLVKADIDNAKSLSISDLKAIYKKISLLDTVNSEALKQELDNIFADVLILEVEKQSSEFGEISTNDDFLNYKRLKQIIPTEIDETFKRKIDDEINGIIARKSTANFKVDLWLLDLTSEVSLELITTKFISYDTNLEKKVSILLKTTLTNQIELIKQYESRYKWIKTYELIGEYLKKINNLSYSFNFKVEIFNQEFWIDKKGIELLYFINEFAIDKSTAEEQFDLFFEGLTQLFPRDLIVKNINDLGESQIGKILKHTDCDQNFAFQILSEKVVEENIGNFNWLFYFAKERLNATFFEQFDNKVKSVISDDKYFDFWRNGKGKIFPQNYIKTLLNDEIKTYEQINLWLSDRITTKQVISEFLLATINQGEAISDRIIFYRLFNHIKFLTELDKEFVLPIREMNNDFAEIVLWFLGQSEKLNFDLLKLKFIYFNPEHQVVAIKKLFSLISKGVFNFSIEQLNELTRIDLDLYRTNLKFNPSIPLDVSTDVILKALLNYKEKGKFLVESELLTVVLNNLYGDTKRKFKLKNYFEACKGRLTAEFNWSRNGQIRKIPFGDNQFYFSIEFEYSPNLVEEVKKITGRKWNPETKFWGVPSKYEQEVMDFASKNRFFLDFEGSNYANNTHLAEFKRKEIPNGITFCEGRVANKQHDMFKQVFWWCGNQPCFQNCETPHLQDDWIEYSLLDFITILGFNVDENKTNPNDFVFKGHYYQFISLINRFNRLLEKIYCEECEEILYPVQTSHFAAYSVVRFCCENSKCSKHKVEVYLNHCLNGQCNSIIDSRISKKCPNGLFICECCGSCCSHDMLSRRKNNLETTGGYIHAQLINCVNKKLGHLERAEYFCYRCGNGMEEKGDEEFVCNGCGVNYETSKYKIKRPHRHLRNETPNQDSDFDGLQEPLF